VSTFSREAGAALIEHAQSLDCIHCGLCLHTCPTYQLTGNESASPRGRIHLMRAEAEGRIEPDHSFEEAMNSCLLCLRCESVCPAGVRFESMMESCRDGLDSVRPKGWLARLARRIGFGRILPSRTGIRFTLGALKLAQILGLTRLAPLLLGARGRALASLPSVPPRAERQPLDLAAPASGSETQEAWLMEGCVMPELFGRVNRASAAVLAAAGVHCRTRAEHTCCGALHAHNGDLAGARDLARSTIITFESSEDIPIVVNSAGCGSHMKEYPRLFTEDPEWLDRAQAFSSRVVDFTEFLATPERLDPLKSRLGRSKSGTLAFDDPCHLCHGQGVRSAPRTLLAAIPGVEVVELEDPEACCGSAGIHSMLRPEDSSALLADKLRDLERSGAQTLVTANPGCHMQWAGGLAQAKPGKQVQHIAEVLAKALEPDAS
jgi:glycolate oxidase iron-sulfur subunit